MVEFRDPLRPGKVVHAIYSFIDEITDYMQEKVSPGDVVEWDFVFAPREDEYGDKVPGYTIYIELHRPRNHVNPPDFEHEWFWGTSWHWDWWARDEMGEEDQMRHWINVIWEKLEFGLITLPIED